MHKPAYALIVLGLAFVAVGIGASGRATRQTPATARSSSGFLIRNVRVFDGERSIPRASVLVRDGKIVSVGPDIDPPAGVEVISGEGRTLLPGLIDSHTHAFGDALERALVFGVTTELDMFTEHRFAAAMRTEQRSAPGAPRRADLLSAGTLVTAPGGHGTEYGMKIPTLASAAEAEAFVDARLAEGSDYIKIVYDDGGSYGLSTPSIDRPTLMAVVAATRRRGKLAVVHIGSRRAAEHAIGAGASGLVHVFADAASDGDFVKQVLQAKAFVIPTLSVTESTTGVPSGASLGKDVHLLPFVTATERTSLNSAFPKRSMSKQNLQHALDTVKDLHKAGVPILAGTDAPNPGTTHGASIHRELDLLVSAGLTPAAALTAATATPARLFSLGDRGRIAPGLRADLVLVEGDPTADVAAARRIIGIWKGGARLDRREAASATTNAPAPATDGSISDFETDTSAAFGAGWQVSTDNLMGGKSEAKMAQVSSGADGSRGALEVTGTLAAGAAFPWAGAMFFSGPAPMAPADVSKFKELVFWTRGDGREYQVMVFATRLGNIPASRPFVAGPEWRQHVMPLSSFSGVDGSDLRGVLFSASGDPSPFRFVIDNVRLR